MSHLTTSCGGWWGCRPEGKAARSATISTASWIQNNLDNNIVSENSLFSKASSGPGSVSNALHMFLYSTLRADLFILILQMGKWRHQEICASHQRTVVCIKREFHMDLIMASLEWNRNVLNHIKQSDTQSSSSSITHYLCSEAHELFSRSNGR